MALNEMYRVLKSGGLAFLEIVNAERKEIAEKVKREGIGADKRIWSRIFGGVKNLDYMHSRKTLRAVCEKSKFEHFRIRFMNLHGRRCIVAELYK